MNTHPDEWVFFRSTSSLLDAIIHPGAEFHEAKEYPEGAYLFHLPFHLLAKIVSHITGVQQNLQIYGRIASVFYFSLAALLGMLIMWKYLGKNMLSVVLYGFTMCFSLFFIEHSRYGVGDMISTFLLLLIIYSTAKAFSLGSHTGYLLLACIASGAMGAVKYPQIYFLTIPLSVFWYSSRQTIKKRLFKTFLLVLTALTTFLLFSPKALVDPKYILRVIQSEATAYVTEETNFEAGGLKNHIAASVIYSLVYSDYPLSLLLFVGGFIFWIRKNHTLVNKNVSNRKSPILFLLHCVVPITAFIFFIYNLFVKLLIFRTYTPFFGISALYSSFWAAELYRRRSLLVKGIIAVLVSFMILRGCSLIYLTSSQDHILKDFESKIEAAVDENWNRTVKLTPYILPVDDRRLIQIESYLLDNFVEMNNGTMRISPGTLVISGGYEYALAGDYIFKDIPGNTYRLETWNAFKTINTDCYVGQAYPNWYYLLFGGWIRGGTLSTSLIPCNLIYYCPADT